MKRISTILVAILFASGPALSMDFEVVSWNGHEAIRATGTISAGATEVLDRALNTIIYAPHGARIILLDSPGGSVGEALAMSDMLRSHQTHMVIPDGARCASACASILFIAGTYRTVEPRGLFGQHSCSRHGVPVPECNEIISMHAFRNGVSHGSVHAFLTNVEPDQILWFSREDVDCWGISRYPFSNRSRFDKSEPCAIRALLGYMPDAQTAWRIDFMGNGYRAFLRPVADHERELELSVFCDERRPGIIFVSMDIDGPADLIRNAITRAALHAPPVIVDDAQFDVVQIDEFYSRVSISVPTGLVVPLLRRSNLLTMTLSVRPPYETIFASTILASSREALIFAANNCMGR